MPRNKVLLEAASEINCKNLLAFEPENVFYITGFWGEAIAVLKHGGTVLVTPKLEAGRARSASRNCEIIESERGSDMLTAALLHLGGGNVCTDCNSYAAIESMRRKLGKRLVHSAGPFYRSRRVKDTKEIATIAQASRILDRLFALCEEEIKPGVSERELQVTLLRAGMMMGAYPPSYRFTLSPLIIASGSNSSLPHAEPTGRRVRRGDLVTVDLTLRYNGYIADATRTFAVGNIDPEKRHIYEIVREAQAAGLDALRAGAKCKSVDNACRSLIKKKGYGKYFIHSTGHGIGLEVHEPPLLGAKSSEIISKNMTVTVEPGIYIPGKHGVRIEDSVLIEGKHVRVLNRYTKDLVTL